MNKFPIISTTQGAVVCLVCYDQLRGSMMLHAMRTGVCAYLLFESSKALFHRPGGVLALAVGVLAFLLRVAVSRSLALQP